MIEFNTLDRRYYSSLGRVFSPIVIESLIKTGKSDYLNEVLTHSGLLNQIDQSKSLSIFFDSLYDYLSKHYRNEYIYKNAITRQFRLGKHFENSQMLTEFRVDNCKADVVILNGTSTVYEIKSEYDSFDRLENQITTYSKAFDQIIVITSLSQLPKLKTILPFEIGIMTLHSNTINSIRNPQSNKSNVEPSIIFDSLRRIEYQEIIKEEFGSIPDVPNTKMHDACKNLYCTFPADKAHDKMLEALKKRDNNKLLKDLINFTPKSLKAYTISTKMNQDKAIKLKRVLRQSLHSILSSNIS